MKKYIAFISLGFLFIVGWNIFLIQRDQKMFSSESGKKAIEKLSQPSSTTIQDFCSRKTEWHPDCDVE